MKKTTITTTVTIEENDERVYLLVIRHRKNGVWNEFAENHLFRDLKEAQNFMYNELTKTGLRTVDYCLNTRKIDRTNYISGLGTLEDGYAAEFNIVSNGVNIDKYRGDIYVKQIN